MATLTPCTLCIYNHHLTLVYIWCVHPNDEGSWIFLNCIAPGCKSTQECEVGDQFEFRNSTDQIVATYTVHVGENTVSVR